MKEEKDMYTYPYNVNGNVQQQLAQNRMEQLQQQYNSMFPQNNMMMQQQQGMQMQVIKGRPVSSYDEAKASMIDLDGSLFVFTDVANKKIYTKQIMLDGSAELKTYALQEEPQPGVVSEVKESKASYVLKKDFDKIMKEVNKQIELLKEGLPYESNGNKDDAAGGKK